MNTSFTPGPWRWKNQSNGSANLFAEDGGKVILCDARLINREANARLIAAAPELLHALQLVMTWNGIYDQSVASAPKAIAEFNMEVGDKIRAAINLATGQES